MDWDHIWRLPGPATFVRSLVSSMHSGRHTVALLPEWLLEEDPTDALMDAVQGESVARRGSSKLSRLRPPERIGHLAQVLGGEIAWGAELTPATLEELLTHEEAAGRHFGLVSEDVREQLTELPEFARRLEQASRSLAAEDRMTLLIVGAHQQLFPRGQSDLRDAAINVVWFWNRLARWDLAALLAAQPDTRGETGLLHEVRMESVIEVARWNVNLALHLWANWSGEAGDISTDLGPASLGKPPTPPRTDPGPHPPTAWLEHWNLGLAEGWHGIMAAHPTCLSGAAGDAQRWIWLAQARVILPWIEERRVKIYERITGILGDEFGHILEDEKKWFPDREPLEDVVLEIKDLAWLVRKHLPGETEIKLAGNVLWKARNKIAHLQPLPTTLLHSMSDSCRFLG